MLPPLSVSIVPEPAPADTELLGSPFTAIVVDPDCPAKVAVTATVPSLAPATSTVQLPNESAHWFTDKNAPPLSVVKVTWPDAELGETDAVHNMLDPTITEDEGHEMETTTCETEATDTLALEELP